MKKVPLKTTMIDTEQGQAQLVYAEHMLNMLRQPKNPQAGIQADEMRITLPIMDKIDSADGVFVLLEDAEHKELVERAQSFRFGIAHTALLTMVDDIKNADEALVEVKDVESK